MINGNKAVLLNDRFIKRVKGKAIKMLKHLYMRDLDRIKNPKNQEWCNCQVKMNKK
jgi:hypothetical protein